MTIQVGYFPHCCGAKMIYGFPTGSIINDWMKAGNGGFTPSIIEAYEKRNAQLRDGMEKEIQRFFDVGFTCHHMGPPNETEFVVNQNDRRSEGSNPLDKNAWVFAITNLEQDHLCRPVLEEFGFKLIDERRNPNSGNKIFFYMLTPTW
jgi:hypothetical protein